MTITNPHDYIQDLCEEATFRSIETPDIHLYGFVTFDKRKLQGPQINNIQNYNIQAHGRIPLNQREFVYMRLYTDKTDQIHDFSMTYCMYLKSNGDTPIEKKFPNATMLNIRADYGHGRNYPHMDVEVFVGRKKIVSQDVEQDQGISNYESAISAVFMQVEKLANPLAGGQYWLSPFELFPSRILKLLKLKNVHGIKTSLSIISRLINIELYKQTRTRISIGEDHFWQIAKSQLELCKQNENVLGGELDIKRDNSICMSVLPFPFFVPDNAEYGFRAYDPNGSEVPIKGGPLAVVSERKNSEVIISEMQR